MIFSNRVLTFGMAFTIFALTPHLASAQLAAGTPAAQFALFAKQNVHLESYTTILGDTYSGADINVDFALGIQRPSRHLGNYYAYRDIITSGGLSDIDGSVWANRSISFDTDFGVEVTGNATYGQSISANASSIVAGTITQSANSVPLLNLPGIASFSPGAVDFVESPGQSVVMLAPGSYRNVTLTSNTDELHLSSGDYFLRRLDTWISTEIHLNLNNGPINVYIENDAFFESGLNFFVNGQEIPSSGDTPPASAALASQVTFEVHGDVTIDSGFLNTFFGTIYAPFGNVDINTQNFYGAIIAGGNITGNTYIEHHASSRLAVPEPSTFCLIVPALAILAAALKRR